MAYMSQEKKATIQAELKRIIPKSWKWSLSVRNHSTLVLMIAAAPVDLLGPYNERRYARWEEWMGEKKPVTHCELYGAALDDFDADTNAILDAIYKAMNDGNHDRSDIMTDYFDVGWYTNINVGRWDKPYVNTTEQRIAA